MENENDSLGEYADALAALLALGLIDVVPAGGTSRYRLSEALLMDDFEPNAALRDRLE
jgi:hypothetical protein